jgi:hypothetical protein
MTRAPWFRILWMGIVTWVVPLAVSFLFYSRDGQLQIDVRTFKVIMFVVGTATGVEMLVLLFRKGIPFPRAGWIAGWSWLVINVIGDLALLVAGFGMPAGTYFATIAPAYLSMPIIAVGMERLLTGSGKG